MSQQIEHPVPEPPSGFVPPPWIQAMQAMADKAEKDTAERLASPSYRQEER